MWVCRLKQMAKDYPVCQDLRCYHVTQWSSLFFFAFQFSSVSQSCPTLCYRMNHSTPGLPVHHQLLEFTQTHVHRVRDAIQPSHPLLSPSPAPNPSQHQSFPMSQLFAWGGQNTEASALASFLPKNTQDWSPLGWSGWISLQSKGLSRVFSNTTVQKYQFFSAQLFHSPTLTSIHDYWKNIYQTPDLLAPWSWICPEL